MSISPLLPPSSLPGSVRGCWEPRLPLGPAATLLFRKCLVCFGEERLTGWPDARGPQQGWWKPLALPGRWPRGRAHDLPAWDAQACSLHPSYMRTHFRYVDSEGVLGAFGRVLGLTDDRESRKGTVACTGPQSPSLVPTRVIGGTGRSFLCRVARVPVSRARGTQTTLATSKHLGPARGEPWLETTGCIGTSRI